MDVRHLDPKIRTVWRASAAVSSVAVSAVCFILTAGLIAGDVIEPLAFAAPAVLGGAGLAAAWWWPGVRYAHWTYRLGDDALELESGVVFRTRSVVPYFRVQHVDTAQGPLERRLGLTSLKLHTASAGTDAALPGLATADAEEIRRTVLMRAGAGDAV